MLAKLGAGYSLRRRKSPHRNLKAKHKGHEKIGAYLDAVREDISPYRGLSGTREQPAPFRFQDAKTGSLFARFTVNVIVDNADTKGAPVVFESNPTYLNLFGRIEQKCCTAWPSPILP
jgi:hypothetical protein